MSNTEQNDPLLEWNRLNIQITEDGFVSALYQSLSETTTAADKFSLWLLAGTGVTGALLITQINSILPFLSPEGFKVCMVLLVLSAISGFIAKYKALRCEIQLHIQIKSKELIDPIFKKHKEGKNEIKEHATQRGIELETEISFSNIMTEFLKPFPWWVKVLMTRKMKKIKGDTLASHRIAFKAYMGQLRWSFFQACLYLLFMVAGAWYASAI